MPENKTSFKDKRKERQQSRVDKLTDKRKEEAKSAGVDLNKPLDIGPLGSERKARIDAAMQEGVKDDVKSGLQRIQSLKQPPEVETPIRPSSDVDIKDVRKERRAKVADILSSLGQGLRGETVDTTRYRDALKDDRLSQYQQYKDTSQKAKQRLDEWELGYINDQLNYLNDRYKDPRTSELEKRELEKALIQLETAKTQRDRGKTALEADKFALEQKKKEAQKAQVPKEQTAKVVSKIGDETTVTEDMPLAKVEEIRKKGEYDKKLNAIDSELELAKLDLESMGNEGTSWWETKDKPKRQELEATIKSLEEEKQKLINESSATPTTQTKNTSQSSNPYADILKDLQPE